jgi:hypothetical protein
MTLILEIAKLTKQSMEPRQGKHTVRATYNFTFLQGNTMEEYTKKPQTRRRRDPAVRCAVRCTIELQAYLHRTGKGRAGATVPLSSSRVLELQAAAPGKGRAPAADAKAIKLQPCAALEDAPSSFRAPCVTSSLPRELDHCGLGAHV